MTTTGPLTPTTPHSATAPTATSHSSVASGRPPRDPTGDTTLVWVELWPDQQPGLRHQLRSDYVEAFWLPVLGPSSILLLRLLAARLAAAPNGFTLDLVDTAHMLGIGHRTGRNSPMQRTLERCCAFGVTRLDHGHQLLVRETLPTLGGRQVARLPATLQKRHSAALRDAAHRPPPAPVEAMRSRCRTLALSLLELGERAEDAETQLHRWRFHPAMAHESVVWARGQLAARLPSPPKQPPPTASSAGAGERPGQLHQRAHPEPGSPR